MKNQNPVSKNQQGAALAVSLIMLLVLTMVGITGMQTTTMEEKMAGNGRDYNLAFQAAEAALRNAEVYVESLVTATDFDPANSHDGLVSESEEDPDYFNGGVWDPAGPIGTNYPNRPVTVSSLYKQQPQYIVKYVAENDPDSNARLNVGGYGEKLAGAQVTVFRITARGTGGTNNSQVLLQSHYGKRF